MKGDFSRIRFEPNKHYTDVLEQQGRIAYDADSNEQRFIDDHRRTVETIDVIGEFGAPQHDAGFAISIVGANILISSGRYYVHGLLCENAATLQYDEQPFLIDDTDAGTLRYLLDELLRAPRQSCLGIYLEVWQRMVTALDDACLGEPALGQADTTVRLQTVWRVVAALFDVPTRTPVESGESSSSGIQSPKNTGQRAHPLKARATTANPVAKGTLELSEGGVEASQTTSGCSCAAMYGETAPVHSGTLSARTADNGGGCGCQPIPAAGYTGLENQLYRVEIHQSGPLATATFKWSRENGSVVVAIVSVSGNQVAVSSLGMDANLGFQEGQWVEISDDTDLYGDTPNLPGTLYQIQHIERSSLTLTMTTTVQPVDTTRHARMRRWDQTDATATTNGLSLSSNWITLENGIEVCFGAGDYVSGDAWTIPARSATGHIDWPPCGSDGNPFQAPHYARIYRAPLACIHVSADAARSSSTLARDASRSAAELGTLISRDSPLEIDDCRRLFPSLTDLGSLIDASALHITGINWTNDDVMTFDQMVANGLVVTFDQAPTAPLSPASFIVTLETPILLQQSDSPYLPTTGALSAKATVAAKSTLAGSARLALEAADSLLLRSTPTVIRSEFILDSTVEQSDNTVSWTVPTQAVSPLQILDLNAINTALRPWALRGTPVRVRVKLPGRLLYASPAGGNQIYLDGQAFGQSIQSTTEQRERIDLRLPTGNDERASDFESWFYLYPTLYVESVAFLYETIWVTGGDAEVSIIRSVPTAPQPIVQQARIYLSYPAVAAASIRLSMTGDATVASVPSQVDVAAGESIVLVNVSINSVPPTGTANFTLSASIATSFDPQAAQTASFNLIGRSVIEVRRAAKTAATSTQRASKATQASAATTQRKNTAKKTPAVSKRSTTSNKRKPS